MSREALHDIRTGRFERTLSALTAAGAAITAGEIYLSHDGASFGNKMMWWPIVVVPTAIPAGVAGVLLPRAARTVLPVASAAIVINGLQGTYLHCARHHATARRLHQVQHGVRAARLRAAAGLAGRRHGSAGRAAAPRKLPLPGDGEALMPFRPKTQRAITPQGRGRFPGFDVLDQAHVWDDVTAGVVLARLTLPNDAVVLHPARGRRRRSRCSTCCSPRTASRASRCWR